HGSPSGWPLGAVGGRWGRADGHLRPPNTDLCPAILRSRPVILRIGPAILRRDGPPARGRPEILRGCPEILRLCPAILRCDRPPARGCPPILRGCPEILRCRSAYAGFFPVIPQMRRSSASGVTAGRRSTHLRLPRNIGTFTPSGAPGRSTGITRRLSRTAKLSAAAISSSSQGPIPEAPRNTATLLDA